MATNGEKRAEIYTYEAPWMIYAANWSVRETTKRLDGLDARATASDGADRARLEYSIRRAVHVTMCDECRLTRLCLCVFVIMHRCDKINRID